MNTQHKRILVTFPCEPRQAALLKETAPGCEFRFKGAEALRDSNGLIGGRPLLQMMDEGPVTGEDTAWAQIILGNVEPPLLQGARELEWMQTTSAGVEPYLQPGNFPEKALLTNATGAYGLAISEHMLGMLLMLMKKLELYRDSEKTGAWASQGTVSSLYGATVLVLGLGDIGGEFGRRCKALGARVIGLRRRNTQKPDYADAVYLTEDLDKLLPQADVVAVTLPGTPDTRGMLGRERLAAMKDGAFLLNVGRGYIVDTDALCDALESGKLAGAGLDVTEPEPLPPDHRLWKLPTAVITPHISGYFHLRETYDRIFSLFLDNLGRFLGGKELQNQVDFSAGYRKQP